MGSMYEIRCECGYDLRIFHSIGMMYPLACQERMKAVRKGQYGEEMKKAARIVPHAALCCERELLYCPGCGDLTNDTPIRLCAPIGKYKPRTGRFSSGCPNQNGLDYVMGNEIGERYYPVLEKFPICRRCNMEMRIVSIDDEHRCPGCGKPVKAKHVGMWD